MSEWFFEMTDNAKTGGGGRRRCRIKYTFRDRIGYSARSGTDRVWVCCASFYWEETLSFVAIDMRKTIIRAEFYRFLPQSQQSATRMRSAHHFGERIRHTVTTADKRLTACVLPRAERRFALGVSAKSECAKEMKTWAVWHATQES